MASRFRSSCSRYIFFTVSSTSISASPPPVATQLVILTRTRSKAMPSGTRIVVSAPDLVVQPVALAVGHQLADAAQAGSRAAFDLLDRLVHRVECLLECRACRHKPESLVAVKKPGGLIDARRKRCIILGLLYLTKLLRYSSPPRGPRGWSETARASRPHR